MKKSIGFLIIGCLVMSSLSGCGNTTTVDKIIEDKNQSDKKVVNSDDNSQTDESDDTSDKMPDGEMFDPKSDEMIDLTKLSSAMVYGQVYDMMGSPDNYLGKQVRMSGTFSVFEGKKKNYYACVVADATACCQQGIEFELEGEYDYPDDYPELGEEITVVGTFNTYVEDGANYFFLDKAAFE